MENGAMQKYPATTSRRTESSLSWAIEARGVGSQEPWAALDGFVPACSGHSLNALQEKRFGIRE